MGYIAIIEHGGRKIQIGSTGGQYVLQPDFRPPRLELVNIYAEGTSATNGGEYDAIRSTTSPVRVEIPFNVTGSSDVHVNMAIDSLNAFLQEIQASRGYQPGYFSWRTNNDIVHDIVWGQNNRRARIRSGYATVETSNTFGIASMRERAIAGCTLVLEIDTIEGYRQQLAHAKGAVFEDTLGNGTLGNVSRGVTVAPAQTNLFNRVGGNALTAVNAYAIDGIALLDQRDEFAAWGLRGPHYSYNYQCATPGYLTAYYRTIAKTDTKPWHCFSFLAKREDGGVVTSSDVRVYVDGTYTNSTNARISIGNGWYYCYYVFETSGTGTVDVGIVAYSFESIHATMFGLSEAADKYGTDGVGGLLPITPIHGEFPGCAWSGTYWESGWTSAGGRLRIPCADWFTQGAGTIRFVRTHYVPDNALFAKQHTLIDVDSQMWLQRHYDGYMRIYDAGGSSAVVAHSYSTGITSEVYHITWNSSSHSTKVYINGVEAGNLAVLTMNAQPNYIYLGSLADGTDQNWATFSDFQFFAEPFTDSDVANDYANISPVMTAGRAESYIPYLWTLDGDGVFDIECDETDSDCGFLAGIGGDIPARTIWDVEKNGRDDRGTIIGMWDTYQFVNPARYGDWTASTQSIGYPTYTSMSIININDTYTDHLIGKLAYLLVDCEDSGDAYAEMLRLKFSVADASSPIVQIDPETSGGIYILGPLSLPRNFTLENYLNGDYSTFCELKMSRSTGSAHNATLNKARLVFDRLWRTENKKSNVVDGQRGYDDDTQITSVGSNLDVVPHRYNQCVVWSADIGNAGSHVNPVSVNIVIIPRYIVM